MNKDEYLKNIIEYENEHTCLDFKKSQYVKENYASLLKDVIAMANAIATGDKYIVIGVKHFPDGNREFYPIENFIDSATYQQIIRENIEPELHIEYEPYQHEQGLLGIFHLLDCTNPPYLLKKDYCNLKKGDCFIRKGSHQTKISRNDLDKIYEIRNKQSKFSGVVKIGFFNTDYSEEITLPTINLDSLPLCSIMKFFDVTKNKIKNIEHLKKDYNIMELESAKLNFEIFNNAEEYLQDAGIRIEIPKNDNCYIVAEKILKEPSYNILLDISAINKSNLHYPAIKYNEEKILIYQNIDNIKHQLTTKVFDYDVRLAVIKNPENGIIPIDLKLFAKNLPVPIHKRLVIKII